jgi:D-alanyl-D-alanine endopeptidase (penicillin-binding protein 7)
LILRDFLGSPTLGLPERKVAAVRWEQKHGWNRPLLAAAVVSVGLLLSAAPGDANAAQVSTSSKKASSATPSATPSARPVARAESTKSVRSARPAAASRAQRKVAAVPAQPSFGQVAGLHSAFDPLDLKSSVAFVIDQDTDQVLLSKNSSAVLPIASITKLMTALVVVEAGLPLDERLTIDNADVVGANRSRLAVGTQMSRGDLLHLALMSSENRAAHALGRNFPGGLDAFVGAMNSKAQQLGMRDTRYVEPTGLSSDNQSSAIDLSMLVKAASDHSLIRELSTARDAQVAVGARQVQYRNTNGLVSNPSWDIALQKTGYISAAGRCVVMQAELAGRKLIMVLLDSAGKYSRIGDAERIRHWLAQSLPARDALAPQGTAPI